MILLNLFTEVYNIMESFIKQIPICNTLDQANVESIAKLYVFNSYCGKEYACIYMYMSITNDEVFPLGDNYYGCLGLGDDISRSEPQQITQLSKLQQRKSITSRGWEQVFVVTECGELFSWDYNVYGWLEYHGTCNTNHGLIPAKVSTTKVTMQDKNIMAFTDDGEVFAWGYNWHGQLGCGSAADQSSSWRINVVKAMGTASGWWYYSVAVLDNGEVMCIVDLAMDTLTDTMTVVTDPQLNRCKVEVL